MILHHVFLVLVHYDCDFLRVRAALSLRRLQPPAASRWRNERNCWIPKCSCRKVPDTSSEQMLRLRRWQSGVSTESTKPSVREVFKPTQTDGDFRERQVSGVMEVIQTRGIYFVSGELWVWEDFTVTWGSMLFSIYIMNPFVIKEYIYLLT